MLWYECESLSDHLVGGTRFTFWPKKKPDPHLYIIEKYCPHLSSKGNPLVPLLTRQPR